MRLLASSVCVYTFPRNCYSEIYFISKWPLSVCLKVTSLSVLTNWSLRTLSSLWPLTVRPQTLKEGNSIYEVQGYHTLLIGDSMRCRAGLRVVCWIRNY